MQKVPKLYKNANVIFTWFSGARLAGGASLVTSTADVRGVIVTETSTCAIVWLVTRGLVSVWGASTTLLDPDVRNVEIGSTVTRSTSRTANVRYNNGCKTASNYTMYYFTWFYISLFFVIFRMRLWHGWLGLVWSSKRRLYVQNKCGWTPLRPLWRKLILPHYPSPCPFFHSVLLRSALPLF